MAAEPYQLGLLLKSVVPWAMRVSAVAPALSLLSLFAVQSSPGHAIRVHSNEGSPGTTRQCCTRQGSARTAINVKKKAGMCLTIQPLPAKESESDGDG